MDLNHRIHELLGGLQETIGPSPYDIAWVAQVPDKGTEAPRWPNLINWLIEHQWLDGSWGGSLPYYHDRILCTLAAIIALKKYPTGTSSFDAIKLGERYIWNHLHFLRQDPIELAGFELLLPTLLTQARLLDLVVPSHSCGYGNIRATKLKLLPPELLYSPYISTAFSLEFLGDTVDKNRLHSLQSPNGSVANSPATTAYLILQTGNNAKAIEYLESMCALPGGIPAFHPFRTYEISWVLEHLSFGDIKLNGLVKPSTWEMLSSVLKPEGIGIDPSFSINDGDTTAVTLHVLALGEFPVDTSILRYFEEPELHTFRTFKFERNASVTTNAHALGALSLMPDYPNKDIVFDHIVAMLLADRKYESYWIDKWHVSPYYATAHVLTTLIKIQEPLISECIGSIEWLLHTQRDDGSWGYFNRGTCEETAYALLSLLQYHRQIKEIDTEILKRGITYLELEMPLNPSGYPEMWISKTLSASADIIKAAILAALNLYKETFGCLPSDQI